MQPAAARRAHRPPRVEPRRGRRTCSPTWSRAGVRTICFARSRRAAELIYQFARTRLEDDRATTPAASTPYRAGYTPQQRREIERRLASGELLGVVTTNALELGHRHRPPRRGDVGHLPGHGREPAPAVGPRRAHRARRPRDVRRRRRRARPVLLPPPRGVPRPPGRGRDPRPHLRDDLHEPPVRGRLRGAARAPRTRRRSAPAFDRRRRPARDGRASCASATAATSRAEPDFPAAQALAALRVAGQLHDRRTPTAAS